MEGWKKGVGTDASIVLDGPCALGGLEVARSSGVLRGYVCLLR